jgi:hypothetical protein
MQKWQLQQLFNKIERWIFTIMSLFLSLVVLSMVANLTTSSITEQSKFLLLIFSMLALCFNAGICILLRETKILIETLKIAAVLFSLVSVLMVIFDILLRSWLDLL